MGVLRDGAPRCRVRSSGSQNTTGGELSSCCLFAPLSNSFLAVLVGRDIRGLCLDRNRGIVGGAVHPVEAPEADAGQVVGEHDQPASKPLGPAVRQTCIPRRWRDSQRAAIRPDFALFLLVPGSGVRATSQAAAAADRGLYQVHVRVGDFFSCCGIYLWGGTAHAQESPAGLCTGGASRVRLLSR